jgi:hypothetical protein
MWDVEGKKYLDFLSAYSAVSGGHNNKRIIQAMNDQLNKIDVPSRAFYTDILGAYAEKLCAFTGMDKMLPMNTGAEAVETAIKAARRYGYQVKNIPQDKAEIIMATKDMVDQITGWLEDVAAMKSEHLLELLDSIRESLGSDVAQQYQDAVKPALEAIYTSLETSRQGLSTGLSAVSGEAAPTMGAPAPGGEPDMGAPMGAPGGEPDMGAPMGAPGMGGAPAGREKRESVDYSRRLGILLNSKKK